jgi:DNA-binding XRE family transcriptional regulator
MVEVDASCVGRKAFRKRVLDEARELGARPSARRRFWAAFGTTLAEPAPATLVVGDLQKLLQAFRSQPTHRWVSSIRRHRPWILALVRTQKDERTSAELGELMRASDLRVSVCRVRGADAHELSRYLRESLMALRPDTITMARYSPPTQLFWVEFGDGLSGLVDARRLGLAGRDDLSLDTAGPGEGGHTLDIQRTDGTAYEIDALSVRAALDHHTAAALRNEAEPGTESTGRRIADKRRRRGLTQIQLARRAGVDQAVISRVERGRQRPRIDTLQRLARGLGMSVADLLAATPAGN